MTATLLPAGVNISKLTIAPQSTSGSAPVQGNHYNFCQTNSFLLVQPFAPYIEVYTQTLRENGWISRKNSNQNLGKLCSEPRNSYISKTSLVQCPLVGPSPHSDAVTASFENNVDIEALTLRTYIRSWSLKWMGWDWLVGTGVTTALKIINIDEDVEKEVKAASAKEKMRFERQDRPSAHPVIYPPPPKMPPFQPDELWLVFLGLGAN